MQALPRWRNLLILRNSMASSTCTTARLASSFHSSPASFEKRKDKWSFDLKSPEPPSKNFIRYAVRHKRVDAKKALKNLLFNGGYSPKVSHQNIQKEEGNSGPKKHRSKSCQHPEKSNHKKMKQSFSDDENDPETIFQATYGKRWYTWSFNARHNPFNDTSFGFEWRVPPSSKDENKTWENCSDIDSDDEECTIGSCSDREVIGLPLTGPLKSEDAKKAFHLSALKWHPDKHQGSSQEMAAEKFRHCVNAYNSLCNALSTT